MPIPRMRFNVRRMMFAVVVFAVGISAIRWFTQIPHRTWVNFHADGHKMFLEEADRLDKLALEPMKWGEGNSQRFAEMAKDMRQKAEYSGEWLRKYENMPAIWWVVIGAPNPPPPW